MTAAAEIWIVPSAGACGAEIKGIDCSRSLRPHEVATIKTGLFDHGVVFFRKQKLTDQQLVAFGLNFGDLHAYEVTEYEKPK